MPGSISVPQIIQQQTEWCWAACAQMVLSFRGNQTVQQCDLANQLFGQSNCCQFPASGLCNNAAHVNDISSVYGQFGVSAHLVFSNISFQALQSEIQNGRPVLVGFAFNGGGFHQAVVRGWDIDNTGPYLLVNDPQYGAGSVYYVNLVAAYGWGSWQWTWQNIH